MSRTRCFLVSDLHGRIDRYEKLFTAIHRERPDVVFLGGDLLPHLWSTATAAGDFPAEAILSSVRGLQKTLGEQAPQILLILGNDDERAAEERARSRHALGFGCTVVVLIVLAAALFIVPALVTNSFILREFFVIYEKLALHFII